MNYNNCLVSMHTTKVTSTIMHIKDVNFHFLHYAPDDPGRAGYMQQLQILNEELETALQELYEFEIVIVDCLKKRDCESDDTENRGKERG